MKNLYLTTLVVAVGLISTSCNDDFLEKYPINQPLEPNAFKTSDNFKAFAYPLYGLFPTGTDYVGDYYSGYLTYKTTSSQNRYAWQTVADAVSGNGWDFSAIRRANILLANIDNSEMTNSEKNYWRAVGYFFHAYQYMELINRFGDVPWVDKVIDGNSPEAYGARTPRKEVSDKVLERLLWAESNIGNKKGENTISKEVIQAVLSRFTLREGTWRKYHNLGDYDKYFTECVRVSQELMNKYPTLYQGTGGQPAAGYGELWTTESLKDVPGIILHKEFFDNSYFRSNSNYLEHTSSHFYEMPQHIVDMYLTTNGLPITNANNTLYQGDDTPYKTFRNRDPRMYQTIMPPYKVIEDNSPKDPSQGGRTWRYTTNPADREYIDIMGANISANNPGVGMKRLPAQNWGALLVPSVPNFVGGVGAKAFVSCRSGYYVWKNYDNWETNFSSAPLNTADKPIFKIEEVLLNYAEAQFELGTFDQSVADKSINKLRQRASVANMIVANIDANFDPKRDPSVEPVLWEIRRERIIELMGEGFGFDDVRRWKKAEWFINKQPYGMWIQKTQLIAREHPTAIVDLTTGYPSSSANRGYRYLFNDPVKDGKGWLEKYYLYEVPSNEILLNPALKPNNPGY